MGALDGIATDDPLVHVVLPTPAGRRIANADVATAVSAIGEGHSLVSIRLGGTGSACDARLEQVLLLGYEASFT
jgi:hypothetical protein